MAIINGTAGVDTLVGGVDDDQISGLDGGDSLVGAGGNDTIDGGDGADTIFGDGGIDSLIGGQGDDVFTFSWHTPAWHAIAGGAGYDVIRAVSGDTWVRLSSFSGIEHFEAYPGDTLQIMGSGGDDYLDFTGVTYSALAWINGDLGNDTLIGSGGAEQLNGYWGDDSLVGAAGDDTLIGDLGVDTISYAGAAGAVSVNLWYDTWQNLGGTATGAAGTDKLFTIENVVGSGFNDSINGQDGANLLDGGAGDDSLGGGLGNDSLVGGSGTDTAHYSGAFTAYSITSSGANILVTHTATGEVDTLSGMEWITFSDRTVPAVPGGGIETLNGTAGNDTLAGTSAPTLINALGGNDSLVGGGGADTMNGGLGNDSYSVDQPGDVINEAAGEGTDTVYSTISYVLGAGLENLTLTGSATLNGTGNSADNAIFGNSGVNALAGGEGADSLYGMGGNDTLSGAAGNDRLMGGTGNDRLEGGDGGGRLDGEEGSDTMVGGAGNDTYYVDSAGDVVVETDPSSYDTVVTWIDYTLAGTVEQITMMGLADLVGVGSDNDNTIAANTGSNRLEGLGGNDTLSGNLGLDTMIGGLGDDRFVVNDLGDVVVEVAGEGVDTVLTHVDWILGDSVENLVLYFASATAFNGQGNALNNALTGNGLNNTLLGQGGDDTVSGAAGGDTLAGGDGGDSLDGGADTDSVSGGAGADTILGAAGSDSIDGGVGDDVFLYNAAIGNSSGNGFDDLIGGDGFDEIRAVGTSGLIGLRSITGVEQISGAGYSNVRIQLGPTDDYLDFSNVTVVNVDRVEGEAGADTVIGPSTGLKFRGGAGHDSLAGGGGADSFIGEAGQDSIAGGGGSDTLDGGAEVDRLTGGAGADVFRFFTAAEANGDLVSDFIVGEDRLDVSWMDSNGAASGNPDFVFIGTAAFSNVAGQLRYDLGTPGKTLVQGDVTGDGVADLQIELTGQMSLSASDFIL